MTLCGNLCRLLGLVLINTAAGAPRNRGVTVNCQWPRARRPPATQAELRLRVSLAGARTQAGSGLSAAAASGSPPAGRGPAGFLPVPKPTLAAMPRPPPVPPPGAVPVSSYGDGDGPGPRAGPGSPTLSRVKSESRPGGRRRGLGSRNFKPELRDLKEGWKDPAAGVDLAAFKLRRAGAPCNRDLPFRTLCVKTWGCSVD